MPQFLVLCKAVTLSGKSWPASCSGVQHRNTMTDSQMLHVLQGKKKHSEVENVTSSIHTSSDMLGWGGSRKRQLPDTKTGSPRRKRMTSLFLPEMELRHSDVTTLGPPGRRPLPSGMSGGQTTGRPRLSRAEGALYVFWGTEE